MIPLESCFYQGIYSALQSKACMNYLNRQPNHFVMIRGRHCSTIFLPASFLAWYGSTLKTPEKIEDDQKENLLDDLITVFERCNRWDDETAIMENTNLQTIIHF